MFSSIWLLLTNIIDFLEALFPGGEGGGVSHLQTVMMLLYGGRADRQAGPGGDLSVSYPESVL